MHVLINTIINFLNLLLVDVLSLVLFVRKQVLNLHMRTYANYKIYIVKNLKLDNFSKLILKIKLLICNNRLSKKLKHVSGEKVICKIENYWI